MSNFVFPPITKYYLGSRLEWDRPESPGVSPNRGGGRDQLYGTIDTLDLIPHTFSQNDVSMSE